MKIAVLTLTRDRLAYTQHCFEQLRRYAGCEYDHFVLDQDSSDGTIDWLIDEWNADRVDWLMRSRTNIGIARGMNELLDAAAELREYDVIVKFDNDCELTMPNTLRDVCQLVKDTGMILSPRILGLNNPPAMTGVIDFNGERILDIPQIGGIFLAAEASVYSHYRYPKAGPMWGLDDANICAWFRSEGGACGYVERLSATHYETTSGQHERYPDYFARTLAEGKPSL